MVEMLNDNAAGLVKSKLAELRGLLKDSDLEKSASNQNDDHMKMDVEGIRTALRGDYLEAARILVKQNEYVKQHPELRKDNNGLIAMANSMCAISLLKIGRIDEAETVLKQETQFDAVGFNKQAHIKDLNVRAMSLVNVLKRAETKVIDEVKAVGHNLTEKFLSVTIADMTDRIKKYGTAMEQLQTEMLRTNDSTRREQLMRQHTITCFENNADSITKLEAQGIQAALVNQDHEKAVAFFKAAFDVIDQDETIRTSGPRDKEVTRHVPQVFTDMASSIYGFSLLELGRFAEAEKRFAKEVDRDNRGLNSNISVSRRLNQVGLEYARLQQDKTQEIAQMQTVPMAKPALQPVLR